MVKQSDQEKDPNRCSTVHDQFIHLLRRGRKGTFNPGLRLILEGGLEQGEREFIELNGSQGSSTIIQHIAVPMVPHVNIY